MPNDPPFEWDRVQGWTATVLVALAMVTSLALAGVGGAAAAGPAASAADGPAALQDDGDNSTLEPADEIYVSDDGDAVLQYESDATDITTGRFSVDVSAGLLHALAVTETDGEFDGSLDASAVLEPGRLAGNGSLTVARPEGLESLDLQVSGASTTEESALDATMSAAFATSTAPTAQLVSSASTSGEFVTTGSAMTTEGSAEVQLAQPIAPEMYQSFSLSESDGTYTLSGEQDMRVSADQRSAWETRERARQALQAQYAAVAQQLGGEATVTLDSYSFEPVEGGNAYRLDIAFSVEYTGVEDALNRVITQLLASSAQFDLSEAEAGAIADRVAAITIDDISFTLDVGGDSGTVSWSARVENYNELSLAAADLLESMETGEGGFGGVEGASSTLPDPQTIRDRVAALRSTNYTQRVTWTGEVAQPSSERLSVDAELHVASENRAAYVSALQDAGIGTTNVTFDVSARAEGEDVLATASFEMDSHQMLDQGLDSVLNASDSASMSPEAREAIQAFKQAELQRAKFGFSLSDGTGRIEAAAKFEDLSAFRDVLAADGRMPNITGLTGEVADETTSSYIHVRSAVGADASEEDVRALGYVDDDTVVHMPGTYNRTFQGANGSDAREYLGLPSPTPTEGGGGSTGALGPGFGTVAALAALGAAVALLARRRSA